jgi:hypothetical protein
MSLFALLSTATGVVSTGVVSSLARITMGRLLEFSPYLAIQCANIVRARSEDD